MNVPFQGPPGIDHPILVPHLREAVFDSYHERVQLDGPVWHLNDPGHNFRLDWTALEFTHRGMVEATADYLVDLITSSSASHVQNAFQALKRLKTLGAFRRWSHPTIRLGNRPDLLQTFFYEAREAAKLSVGELHHLQHWFRFLSKREGSGVNPTSASIVNAITVGGNPKESPSSPGIPRVARSTMPRPRRCCRRCVPPRRPIRFRSTVSPWSGSASSSGRTPA